MGAVTAAVLGIGALHVIPPSSALSPYRRTISEYALMETGAIFNVAVLVLAAGSVATVLALVGAALAPARSGGVLALLLWSFALAAVVYFPKHNWAVGPSAEGTVHRVASVVAFLSLPVAALLYLWRKPVAGIAAALSVVAVLTAPLTLPQLADHPLMLRDADTVKTSLAHRFYIWDFAGKRIAERPLLGWGLDAARAIPGGKERIRGNQRRLPLHPHDAPLQVWLELGLPGAVLFAALLGWLWLRLGTASWPPLHAASAGGSLAAICAILSAGWGIWQEWWLATLGMAAFAILTMARAAAEPAIPPPPCAPRGGDR